MSSPVVTHMDFLSALAEVMDNNSKITRVDWNNSDIYILLRNGFLSIRNDDGFHRLLVSEEDMYAKDWIVVQSNATIVN